MKLLSMNVGLPRKVLFNGQIITTATFKDPVKCPIMLRKLNLDGDKQADLTVHGGVIRHYVPILQNIMTTGVNNFLIWILYGECLERTLLLKDY